MYHAMCLFTSLVYAVFSFCLSMWHRRMAQDESWVPGAVPRWFTRPTIHTWCRVTTLIKFQHITTKSNRLNCNNSTKYQATLYNNATNLAPRPTSLSTIYHCTEQVNTIHWFLYFWCILWQHSPGGNWQYQFFLAFFGKKINGTIPEAFLIYCVII